MAKERIVWFEVLGENAGKLRSFYGELFNWTFKMAPDESMDYGMTDESATGIGGGVGKSPSGSGWTTFYVGVSDIEAAVRRATELGGKVLMPITKLPDTTIAVVADPEGHPVGLAAS